MISSPAVQLGRRYNKNTSPRFFLVCLAGCFWIAAYWAAPSLTAGDRQAPQHSTPDIHNLIKNMAWNELQAGEHPAHYYRYLNRSVSPDGSRTTEQIGTSQGIVKLLLAVDGKPPTAKQRQANDHFLSELVHDPSFRQSRLKDQRQDTERRDNVIKNLPQAFIYTYVGTTRDGLIHIKFRPDPEFSPSSRQALILQGMAGDLWVDRSDQRMVKIDGTLIKDVKIGWGFLAHLYKGGRFLMDQSKGPDGAWHQRLLAVDFDGTELIFKGIHIHEKEIRCCFERVPDGLTIVKAVQMLRTQKSLPEHWKSTLDEIEKSSRSR